MVFIDFVTYYCTEQCPIKALSVRCKRALLGTVEASQVVSVIGKQVKKRRG